MPKLPKRTPWRTVCEASPLPVNAASVHPVAWLTALDLAGWDTARFRVLDWRTVVVLNRPEYPAT